MSSAVAVSTAAKQLKCLLNSANEALDGALRAKLEAGQRELECMHLQSTLTEADQNHDPKVRRLLSVIEGYACNILVAIDDMDFIEFMTRHRSGFERMLFVCSYNDVDKSEDRIIYVLKNLDGVRDAYLALGLAQVRNLGDLVA